MRRKDDIDYEVESMIDAIIDAEMRGVDWHYTEALGKILEQHLRDDRNKPAPPSVTPPTN